VTQISVAAKTIPADTISLAMNDRIFNDLAAVGEVELRDRKSGPGPLVFAALESKLDGVRVLLRSGNDGIGIDELLHVGYISSEKSIRLIYKPGETYSQCFRWIDFPSYSAIYSAVLVCLSRRRWVLEGPEIVRVSMVIRRWTALTAM
jgi:hypothetical protein